MRIIGWWLASLVVVTACGQVEPILMPVAMPECIYQGPVAMHPGKAQVVLSLNGLGAAGVALVELTGEHAHDELVAHLAADDLWQNRPSWALPVIEMEIASPEGAAEDTADLGAGFYSMVCLDDPFNEASTTARPAAAIDVIG